MGRDRTYQRVRVCITRYTAPQYHARPHLLEIRMIRVSGQHIRVVSTVGIDPNAIPAELPARPLKNNDKNDKNDHNDKNDNNDNNDKNDHNDNNDNNDDNNDVLTH